MSGQQELIITLLEALQNKNFKLLTQCIQNQESYVPEVLKDLPVSRCELLLAYLVKKLKNHKQQANSMFWITALVQSRRPLFLQNKKLMDLLDQIPVYNVQ